MKKEFSLEMVYGVLDSLKKKDKFFVSEAHFQTEFIIEAARMFPNNKYYPELVPVDLPKEYEETFGNQAIFFDLIIKCQNDTVLIEFKYLTKAYQEDVDGFVLKVKNQSANDVRRYDCWRDISRIETCVKDNKTKIDYGYFILITNDHLYWDVPRKADTNDKEFRIHNGVHKAATKKWKEGTSEGTKGGRNNNIIIANNYFFNFKDFYKDFKSLVVEIE